MRIGSGSVPKPGAGGNVTEAAGAKALALRKAAQDFEAIFIKQLLSGARSGTPGESLFGPNVASDIMWNMQDQSLAQSIARSRGIGLARVIEQQLGESLKSRATADPGNDAAEGNDS